MGREVRAVPGSASLTTQAASIGAYLRSQRLLRGIGLAELSAVTRIPRRSLERLEEGEFDGPPDGFARGFVRAVATALGVDPDEAVSRMLTEVDVPEEAGRELRLGRVALVLGVALVLVLAVVGGRLWVGRERAADPPDSERVMRRDAVRALAAETPLRSGAGAGPIGPRPIGSVVTPGAAAAEDVEAERAD